MSEWWTYRPHDLLMYSARAYYGLFALENSRVWPLQLMAIAIGATAIEWLWRGRARDQRIAIVLIAVAWCSVAWLYFVNEYSTIHTMARGFAIAFVAQAVLLAIAAGRLAPSDARSRAGVALALIALAGIPLLAPLTGRPWSQAELFALAPDPTVGVTIGALLLLPGEQMVALAHPSPVDTLQRSNVVAAPRLRRPGAAGDRGRRVVHTHHRQEFSRCGLRPIRSIRPIRVEYEP